MLKFGCICIFVKSWMKSCWWSLDYTNCVICRRYENNLPNLNNRKSWSLVHKLIFIDCLCIPLSLTASVVLCMTINCIWWWDYRSRSAIIPRSILAWSGSSYLDPIYWSNRSWELLVLDRNLWNHINEYPFITITLRSTLTWSGSIYLGPIYESNRSV